MYTIVHCQIALLSTTRTYSKFKNNFNFIQLPHYQIDHIHITNDNWTSKQNLFESKIY